MNLPPLHLRYLARYHAIDQSTPPFSLGFVPLPVEDEWFRINDPGLYLDDHLHLLMLQDEVKLLEGPHEFLLGCSRVLVLYLAASQPVTQEAQRQVLAVLEAFEAPEVPDACEAFETCEGF